jgi:hypothetical protein
MKKIIILIIVLIVSFTVSAQEDTFTKRYTSMIAIKNNVAEEETSADLTVVFNYQGQKVIKFYYGSGTIKVLSQISKVEEGKTKSGQEFQLIKVLDNDSGEEFSLQFFGKEKTLRLLFGVWYNLEFYE